MFDKKTLEFFLFEKRKRLLLLLLELENERVFRKYDYSFLLFFSNNFNYKNIRLKIVGALNSKGEVTI